MDGNGYIYDIFLSLQRRMPEKAYVIWGLDEVRGRSGRCGQGGNDNHTKHTFFCANITTRHCYSSEEQWGIFLEP
jgi:hypothetical protein